MNHPRILGIGTANPPDRLTQEQTFHAAGYQSERIRKIFLNGDIDYRHFYLEGAPNREESSDQLNQRYLRGAMKTGCRAILNCLKASATAVQDIDFLAVCTCTGYVCPDVGGYVGYVGVPHGVDLNGEQLFYVHVHLHGGPAPVRRFLPELINLVWKGRINPGKVFDLTLPLDQVAEGYRAMDVRRAIKTLLRP